MSLQKAHTLLGKQPLEMTVFHFCVFLILLNGGSFEAAPVADGLNTLMDRVKSVEVGNGN